MVPLRAVVAEVAPAAMPTVPVGLIEPDTIDNRFVDRRYDSHYETLTGDDSCRVVAYLQPVLVPVAA